MGRSRSRVVLFLLIFIIIAGNFVPTGYTVIGPGVALELDELVEVESGYDFSKGTFMLTSISSRDTNPWQLIFYLLFKPAHYEIVHKSLIIPPGMDMEEYIEIQEEEMKSSKQIAKYVALKLAGYEPKIEGGGAKIEEVFENSPSRGILQPGDIIIGLDGKEVHTSNHLVELLREKSVGEKVQVNIKREKEIKTFEVTTTGLEDFPQVPALGIIISPVTPRFEFPVAIKIKTENIIGPSAGGMFALEILNQLTEENLTGGRRIAGTGTISLTGRLGEIGGVKQKVVTAERHGASIFFCPAGNYDQALESADKIQVVAAETIFDILHFLGWENCDPVSF